MSDIPVKLDNAYNLKDIEQTKTLYRQWAKDYDESFGAQMGLLPPRGLPRYSKTKPMATQHPYWT